MTYIEDENAELLENIYNAETQIDSWHDNRCGSAPHNSTKVFSIYFAIWYVGIFLNMEPRNNSLYEYLSHLANIFYIFFHRYKSKKNDKNVK